MDFIGGSGLGFESVLGTWTRRKLLGAPGGLTVGALAGCLGNQVGAEQRRLAGDWRGFLSGQYVHGTEGWFVMETGFTMEIVNLTVDREEMTVNTLLPFVPLSQKAPFVADVVVRHQMPVVQSSHEEYRAEFTVSEPTVLRRVEGKFDVSFPSEPETDYDMHLDSSSRESVYTTVTKTIICEDEGGVYFRRSTEGSGLDNAGGGRTADRLGPKQLLVSFTNDDSITLEEPDEDYSPPPGIDLPDPNRLFTECPLVWEVETTGHLYKVDWEQERIEEPIRELQTIKTDKHTRKEIQFLDIGVFQLDAESKATFEKQRESDSDAPPRPGPFNPELCKEAYRKVYAKDRRDGRSRPRPGYVRNDKGEINTGRFNGSVATV